MNDRQTLAERILRFALPGAQGETAAGDLREEQLRRTARRQPTGLWTFSQVAAILWFCWLDLLRELVPPASELVQSLRSVCKRPGLALSVTAILALAIGVNSAVFSVVNAVLFKPLPFREPGRLVHLFESAEPKAEFGKILLTRPGNYYEWKARNRVFQQISAYQQRKVALNGSWGADLVLAHRVIEDYFETLGTPPLLGRTFTADDYHTGRSVLLSFDVWMSRFDGDAGILGRTIQIDNISHMVTGVMPRGFYPSQSGKPLLWVPLVLDPATRASRVLWLLSPIARLQDGVTLQQAQAQMTALGSAIRKEHPDNPTVALMPLTTYVLGYHEKVFILLIAAASLVILTACVNVANLLLARNLHRQKEMAVRAAMGASRLRLIRLTLLESLYPALAGGALGILLAWRSVRPIAELLPAGSRVGRIDEIQVDWQTCLFALAAAVASGIIFSLLPAIRSHTTNLHDALKRCGRSVSGAADRRLSDRLVVAEIALAVVMLAAAGLLVRSFLSLQRVESGVRMDNLLTMQVRLPEGKYRGTEAIGAALRRIQEHLQNVPAVRSVGMAVRLPFDQSANPWGFAKQGEPLNAARGRTNLQQVSPEFFETTGMRVLAGRALLPGDTPDRQRVVVINKTLADLYWPGESPVGRSITLDLSNIQPVVTIVGVVSDARLKGVQSATLGELFLPLTQWPYPAVNLFVKTAVAPLILAPAIRASLAEFDRDVPVFDIRTMQQVFEQSLWEPRLAMALIGTFSLLALALSAAGVFALVSYSVARRTPELGVRLMVGATRTQILALVLRHGLALAAAGTAIGLSAAMALGRLIQSQLYYVTPYDPATLTAVALVVMCVALAASLFPAWRASRVDPITAFRVE
jgi:predicted permease